MGGLQQRCLWEVVTPRLSGAASLNGEQRADVCVIGAGFTGLSAALHLLEAGRSVCVLEAYEVGHGGSGRNVGLINAGTWIPPDEVVATLGAEQGEKLNAVLGRAPALVMETIERLGIDCQLRREGTLHMSHNASGVADLQRRHAQWTRRHSQSHGLFARTGHRRRTAGRPTVPALAGARPGAAGRAVGGAQ